MAGHIHIGAPQIVGAFFGVIIVGTVWRAIGFTLAASDGTFSQAVGKAMLFAY